MQDVSFMERYNSSTIAMDGFEVRAYRVPYFPVMPTFFVLFVIVAVLCRRQ